ncbi:hypothetical protein [Listeria ilorinensis]|uniref:hypothetical protein n=1 Tax=Listeria ilorinensis TaxID=2867439 RepID=UPI001EF44EEE|nr:hypothetical protein [Listeria ilorinensis]
MLEIKSKDDPDFVYEYIYVRKDKRIIFSVSKDDIFDDELTKDAKYKKTGLISEDFLIYTITQIKKLLLVFLPVLFLCLEKN